MIHHLGIDEFLSISRGMLVLDVRSEGEFNYGHILWAINLALFNNEERKQVGIAYKQKSRNEAILTGLDLVGKKMAEFVRFAEPKVKDRKIFIHCWRGGMRSGSMAWLFDLLGYEVFVLKGGYKSYRHYVLEQLRRKFKYLLIGGRTGSAKSAILRRLQELGEQVIDLEALACHKGSAFGALGQPAQPSTEHFENLLAELLKTYETEKRVWIEDESKTIGRIFLDLELWNNMRLSPLFVVQLPLEIRIKRLVEEYSVCDPEGIEEALNNIKRRLGTEHCKKAIEALQNKDYAEVVRIALHHYDKAYDKGISMKDSGDVVQFTFETDDIDTIAQKLLDTAKDKYGN